MTQQEEKMIYAAFALAGILSNKPEYYDLAARKAWDMATLMIKYKPNEEKEK